MSFIVPFFFSSPKQKVLVCYGKFEVEKVQGYDLVIVESSFFNFYEVAQLKKNNKKVVAYISLGEVNKNAVEYNFFKNKTLGSNTDWDSYYLDLTSEETVQFLNNKIDAILFMGYDGLFLDNIDNFCAFGAQKEQQNELITFIDTLKVKYPKSYIVQNAGLELVSKTRKNIDSILIESVITNFTFDDKKYKLREEKETQKYLKKIDSICGPSKLPVILLEYSDSKRLNRQVFKKAQKTKFSFLISDINLQELPFD